MATLKPSKGLQLYTCCITKKSTLGPNYGRRNKKCLFFQWVDKVAKSFSIIHTTIKGSCKKSYFLLVARPLKNNQLKVQTIDVVVKNYTFFNGLIKVAKSTHSNVLIHSFLFIEGLKYHLQFYACHGCEFIYS